MASPKLNTLLEGRNGKNWTVYDGTSSEVEMGDVLYGLVRMLKPQVIVETGTYRGNGTKRLAEAARDNDFGHVWTCDTEYDYEYLSICDGLPYTYVKCPSLELPQLREADFVFSDSHEQIRPKEYELVKPGCIFVIHDTDQQYHGPDRPPFLAEWVRSQGGLVFLAGRGFGVLIKP